MEDELVGKIRGIVVVNNPKTHHLWGEGIPSCQEHYPLSRIVVTCVFRLGATYPTWILHSNIDSTPARTILCATRCRPQFAIRTDSRSRLMFPGYRMGRNYRPNGRVATIGTRPGKASVQGFCGRISEQTHRRHVGQDAEEMVERLNRMLFGWSQYSRPGQVSPSCGAMDAHAASELLLPEPADGRASPRLYSCPAWLPTRWANQASP